MNIVNLKLKGGIYRTILVRTARNISQLEYRMEEKIKTYPQDEIYNFVSIDEVWKYSKIKYENLVSDLWASNPDFKKFDGSNYEIDGEFVIGVIAIYCKGKPILLIDPEGKDYPGLVSILQCEE